ncbi:hypothetical protein [uncultured Sphingomonas sp.]|uniref:hypothetical protein n=1 Tax=uncultured Sphingomonas sp. TaxID=158754 RepID=UPI0035CB3947
MDQGRPSRTPLAGGCLIALGLIAGPVAGAYLGQATIGFLVGGAIGAGLALAIWRRGG